MSIVTRRPMRIMDADINLPLLKFQDFDTAPLNCTIASLQTCSLTNDCVAKVMLADIFMSQLNLLLISGRILTHLYNVQGFAASDSEWAMWYAPKRRSHFDAAYLDLLQAELDNWSDKLNNYCHIDYHHDNGTDKLQNNVLRIHAAAMRLLHLLSQEALHRPLTFPAGVQQPVVVSDEINDSAVTRARSSVSYVASQTCDLVRGLREEELWQLVQPLSVGCIMTAIISFLVEIKLAGKVPEELPDHQYHDCVRSLLSLREVWPVTKGSCAMVSQMANKNQIWYARSLKMLAQPTPIDSAENGCDTPGTGSDKSQHAPSQSTLLNSHRSLEPLGAGPISQSHEFDRQPVGNISVPAHFASTYLTTMYPFSWTAADFDVFGPSSCGELFAEHDLDGFGLNGVMAGGIS